MAYDGQFIENGVSRELIDLMVAGGARLATDTFKIALFDEDAFLRLHNPNIFTNEVTGSGYTAGGKSIAVTVSTNGQGQGDYDPSDFIIVDFADVSWTNLTASPRAAVIYNTSNSQVVAIIKFTKTLNLVNQTLTITWPPTNPPLGAPLVIRAHPQF